MPPEQNDQGITTNPNTLKPRIACTHNLASGGYKDVPCLDPESDKARCNKRLVERIMCSLKFWLENEHQDDSGHPMAVVLDAQYGHTSNHLAQAGFPRDAIHVANFNEALVEHKRSCERALEHWHPGYLDRVFETMLPKHLKTLGLFADFCGTFHKQEAGIKKIFKHGRFTRKAVFGFTFCLWSAIVGDLPWKEYIEQISREIRLIAAASNVLLKEVGTPDRYGKMVFLMFEREDTAPMEVLRNTPHANSIRARLQKGKSGSLGVSISKKVKRRSSGVSRGLSQHANKKKRILPPVNALKKKNGSPKPTPARQKKRPRPCAQLSQVDPANPLKTVHVPNFLAGTRARAGASKSKTGSSASRRRQEKGSRTKTAGQVLCPINPVVVPDDDGEEDEGSSNQVLWGVEMDEEEEDDADDAVFYV